jgi:hypothetical protein
MSISSESHEDLIVPTEEPPQRANVAGSNRMDQP